MKNEEIIEIVKQTCSIQDIVVGCIGTTLLRCKEEDFKRKIEQTLAYLDCEAYNDDARGGFRIFAKTLLSVINE
ncbi:MAG: hypothetical protein IKO56_09840 [Alphaproteobacteria bacterium]|nr:hypothetical protein [Alphaproteobacteria bacterium]